VKNRDKAVHAMSNNAQYSTLQTHSILQRKNTSRCAKRTNTVKWFSLILQRVVIPVVTAINDAGYAGYGGGGMGAEEACTATTDAEVIAKWNAKTPCLSENCTTDAKVMVSNLSGNIHCIAKTVNSRVTC
jgi:hypothetical protein